MKVAVGDPITYVSIELRRDKGVQCVRRDYVDGGHDKIPAPNDLGFWLKGDGTPVLFADGEGLTWMRGHHREDSSDAQALLAAYKLARSAA